MAKIEENKGLDWSKERGNVSYAQNGDVLLIAVNLAGNRVTAKSGNKFTASGPVKADMGKLGFAHAWLNVGLPKIVAKKSEIVAERDELAKKVAALEAKLAGK